MLFFLTGIVGLLFVAYCLLIAVYLRRWKAIPDFAIHSASFAPPKSSSAADARAIRITVLIPARNEEAGILDCLRSLGAQTCRKVLFGVMVLDDHSTDDTAEVVLQYAALGANGLSLRCLRIADVPLPPGLTAYKKFAIETGVGA